MTPKEAINWLINLTADIGKSEHCDLWHYEQALYEIRDMLQSLDGKDTNVPSNNLIDRQAVIESIRECAEAAHSNYEWDMEQGYLNAIECIEEEPSARQEQRNGEWIDTEFLKLKECSCCHSQWGMYDVENFDFCPSCGADMRGEQDG